nr:hypothetical protein [uncultured Dethiosulfovibrio sp.]
MKDDEESIIIGGFSISQDEIGLECCKKDIFEGILAKAVLKMQENARCFIKMNSSLFEQKVAEKMSESAEGTLFAGGIKLMSGHSFPDIDAGLSFGVEVKTTVSDKWTSTGNSIFEGCRIRGINHIYIFFGKLNDNPEFKYKRYEECICDVAITHSPRYMIDMEIQQGNSFFDLIKCSYDEYRKDDKLQIEKLREYYLSRNSTSRLWWMPPEQESLAEIEEEAVPMEIRFWSSVSSDERKEIMIECMAKFPVIFGKKRDKYKEVVFYLVKDKNIINKSLRDDFSASGTEERELLGERYREIPRVFLKFLDNMASVLALVLKGYNGLRGEEAMSSWMKSFLLEANETLSSSQTCSLTAEVLKQCLEIEIDKINQNNR